jgi:hypothetical protein
MRGTYKASLKKAGRFGLFAVVLGLVFTGFSCMQKKTPAAQSPAGYNLAAPVTYKMPMSLTEISGLTFYKGDAKTVFAHEDETGHVYYFALGSTDVKDVKFGKHGDYEDIAICKEQVIMLQSDGTLFVFPYGEIKTGNVTHLKTNAGLLPKGEYEGMYADEKTGTLYVICKNCKEDKKEQRTSGYTLKLGANGAITLAGNFSVATDAIDLGGKKKGKFQPSALAKNQLTNEWYILASINKLLVVTDANFKVKQSYKLNSSLFPQPEGMAFDGQNNLYISNEGGMGSGTILKFTYKK